MASLVIIIYSRGATPLTHASIKITRETESGWPNSLISPDAYIVLLSPNAWADQRIEATREIMPADCYHTVITWSRIARTSAFCTGAYILHVISAHYNLIDKRWCEKGLATLDYEYIHNYTHLN